MVVMQDVAGVAHKVPPLPVTAFIAFGGNLGNCCDNFIVARQQFDQAGVVVVASSPLYKTKPVGGPAGQPDYLNAVVQVETTCSALQLLELCLRIEDNAGREREQRWGARTLDLDLLLYDNLVCDLAHLVVPHPRLHQRQFVLEPLCVLAGGQIHPTLHSSFAELLQQLLVQDDVDGQCGGQRVDLAADKW